ncbi:class I SAM-dependent methyltransferase [Weeksellaceae bacterium TAE3-ERU29]|nr:class I SAM-dependent methyltransferase [Weeksellaceae bacterium TAE3-ERU29]
MFHVEQLNKNKVKDFLVTGEEFSLVIDAEVPGMLKTTPKPFTNELSKYYDSKEYISHTDSNKTFIDSLYQKVKQYNLKYKKNIITKSFQPKNVLDYGCGTGSFVEYLNQNGIKAFGYEPNENALELAKNKIGDNLLNEDEVFAKKYDVITLWHVLEHIPNYDLILKSLIECLTPNGKLIIAIPNYKSYDAKFYKNYWAAYDVPRHLWHFSKESIKYIAKDFGMIIDNIKPMYFDAFYVSLLSEKYKGNNSLGFLRAFMIGAYSNFRALFNNQYSSLIYVLCNYKKG